MGIVDCHIRPVIFPNNVPGLFVKCIDRRIQIIVLAKDHFVLVQDRRHSGAPFEYEEWLGEFLLPEQIACFRIQGQHAKCLEVEVNSIGIGSRSGTGVRVGFVNFH